MCYRLDIKVVMCRLVFAAVSKTHLLICSLICAILFPRCHLKWKAKFESKIRMLFKSGFCCIFCYFMQRSIIKDSFTVAAVAAGE